MKIEVYRLGAGGSEKAEAIGRNTKKELTYWGARCGGCGTKTP
jgi:hypothetical protein